jgi:parallel beta-helix repeat protein
MYVWFVHIGDAQKEKKMKNLITCLTVIVLSGVTFATTWTVDDDGKADFDNIQAAVDASSDGDEIIVMVGTYTSAGDEVVNMLGKAVTLRSLYPDNPDVVATTIIDGEGARCGIRCDDGESNKTIVEGFTITAGMAVDGGGIYIRDSSPTITNCSIIDNTANYDGGGLFIRDGSPTITNCTIGSNTADQGGGGLFIREGTPAINQCTIKGNAANKDGGGIYCRDNGNATIINCIIEDNIAGEDGGGLASDDGVPAIGGTRFCGNLPNHIAGTWSDTGGNEFLDSCSADCPEDIDGNSVVDVVDLLAIIGAWGECVGQKVHVVNQIGFTFFPREITVTQGDTIRWVWGGGSHTVTSGTLPCEEDGLFDGPLEDNAPVFDWYVPSNSPDFIEYFCEPHCNQDMNGSISVTSAGFGPGSECPADIDESGTVDVSDLLMVIANWGPCE